MTKKSCLIIAGEKSGEEHANSFFDDLKNANTEVEFFGVGGNDLREKGVDLIYHLDDFSTWGVTEAIRKVPFYLGAAKKIIQEVERRNCKVAILIDFQTFNLKLAEKLKARDVKVLYYVAPQAWAWKSWRTKALAQFVDTLFCIIPFEKKWFKDRGVKNTVAVKHPLYFHHISDVQDYRRQVVDVENRPVKLLHLPGSRDNEVSRILPVFVKVAKKIKKERDITISIVKSSSVNAALYEPFEDEFDSIYFDRDLTKALKDNHLSLAASGTVTLTCAIFSLPTIVAYTSGLLNTFIYENFVSYRGFISLANIIHQKEVFPEIIAESFSSYNVEKELRKLLKNNKYKSRVEELDKTINYISGDDLDLVDFFSEKIGDSYE